MLKNLGLLGGVAAGLLWSAAAFAQIPTPTTFAGAPNLSTITTGTAVWWQTESTPCEGNNVNGPNGIPEGGGGDDVAPASTVFILDPGCALRASDPGAFFLAFPFLEGPSGLGVPAGDLANGFHATLMSDGTTATVTVDKNIWGPLLKFNVDTPGLVTVTAGTVSDYVFTIDVASGDVTSFSWTADADTVLGPASLNAALLGTGTSSFYSAEAAAAPGASGATVWACGTGGFIAQPVNDTTLNPGSFGTCPPDLTNPSPTMTNVAYIPATGTLTSNASSAVLGITPRAWAPLDGRLSVPEPGTMLLIGSGLVGLGAFGRRKSA